MKSRNWLIGVFGCVAALGATWHGWQSIESKPEPAEPTGARFNFPNRVERTAGRQVTNAVSLSDVKIDDGMEVAGLVINGEARAYLLDGMMASDHHIIHDSVGGEDVSVAYCPWLSVVRCMAVPEEEQDQLMQYGWINDTVEISYRTNRFSIEAESLPMPEFPIEIISFVEWRRQHPNSKIYLGEFPTKFKFGKPAPATPAVGKPKST